MSVVRGELWAVHQPAEGLRATQAWAAGLVDRIEDNGWLELLLDGTPADGNFGATVSPRREIWARGLSKALLALRDGRDQDMLTGSFEVSTDEIVVTTDQIIVPDRFPARFSSSRLGLDEDGNMLVTASLALPPPSKVTEDWSACVLELVCWLSEILSPRFGDVRLGPHEHARTGRSPVRKFWWPYPLGESTMPPQVNFYGWIVWLHPAVLTTLGGLDAVRAAAPVALVREVETTDGVGAVAQLMADPQEITDVDLRAWKEYLTPVMNPDPAFVPGQRAEPRPPGVLPDDW